MTNFKNSRQIKREFLKFPKGKFKIDFKTNLNKLKHTNYKFFSVLWKCIKSTKTKITTCLQMIIII